MKYLKKFNESTTDLTQDFWITNQSEIRQIRSICKKYDILDYRINNDLTVDVDGNVDFYGLYLKEIPLNFNRVSGDFRISHNKLKSLKGSPKYVSGNFEASRNQLTSLDGMPEKVEGYISLSENKITSFKGIQKVINNNLYISHNYITTFKDGPTEIKGHLHITCNKLYSLEWMPKVRGEFYFLYGYLNGDRKEYDENPIIALFYYYIPEGSFVVSPYSGWDFVSDIAKEHRCNSSDIERVTEKFINSLNEWNYLRGNKIIKERFMEAMDDMDCDCPPEKDLGEYRYI